MIKYNYFKISKTKKIRYLKHTQNSNLHIVFLHGFMSDIEGKKIKKFLKIESSINYKRSLGSTSPKEVKKAIKNAKKELF